MGKNKNKKQNLSGDGIVYSTNPEYVFADLFAQLQEPDAASAKKGTLYVSLDKKNRAGKAVTLVEGFTGTDADGENLCKTLKNHCGAGGSFKDGEIMVQGDHREKVFKFLINSGWNVKKKGG